MTTKEVVIVLAKIAIQDGRHGGDMRRAIAHFAGMLKEDVSACLLSWPEKNTPEPDTSPSEAIT